ncbi:metallophosphoesterase family protein [Bordetella sp. 2513F-2]
MTCVLHISDTHFGTEVEPVVEALRALCANLRPDLVLLGGDITQRARRGQFAAARRFVESLDRPLLAVPGNHDIPLYNLFARLFDPYGAYRRALGPVLEPAYEDPTLLAIGVNTTRPLRRVDGELSAGQVRRVVQRLKAARPEQLRIVLLHHPVRAIEESDRSNLVMGREEAVSAWLEAGVDLVLGGHIHLPYVVPLRARQDHAGHSGWAVQAGTAVSRRVRGAEPNSVNVIRHESAAGVHRCEVARWDYDGGAFACVDAAPLQWRR